MEVMRINVVPVFTLLACSLVFVHFTQVYMYMYPLSVLLTGIDGEGVEELAATVAPVTASPPSVDTFTSAAGSSSWA